MKQSPLWPWLGAIISKAVSGFAHGAVIGGGVDVATSDVAHLVRMIVIGGCVGAGKDISLYINENPMPNVFAPPQIAELPKPVAVPTVGIVPPATPAQEQPTKQ